MTKYKTAALFTCKCCGEARIYKNGNVSKIWYVLHFRLPIVWLTVQEEPFAGVTEASLVRPTLFNSYILWKRNNIIAPLLRIVVNIF